jgi:hypothetical protein
MVKHQILANITRKKMAIYMNNSKSSKQKAEKYRIKKESQNTMCNLNFKINNLFIVVCKRNQSVTE